MTASISNFITHSDGSVSFTTTVRAAPHAPVPAPVPHPVPVSPPVPKGKAMKIQYVNKSTVVGPAEFLNCVTAVATQDRDDFSPAWEKIPAIIEACLDGVEDPSAYKMYVLDTSDQPGAEGYHDVDSQGKPIGYIFAKTTADAGGKWTVTASHENMEMRLDPSCTLWTQTTDGKMLALEASDAVEADEYTKRVGDTDVAVSNFLTPAYFVGTKTGAPTDFLNKLHGEIAPARTPGGYDIVVDTNGPPSQEFSEHMASLSPEKAKMKTHPTARTARRIARP
jgi:hypothetical protein